MSKVDQLRAMREAKATATAARSGGKVERVPDEVMKRPAELAAPTKPKKAKQKIPSRAIGKAKRSCN